MVLRKEVEREWEEEPEEEEEEREMVWEVGEARLDEQRRWAEAGNELRRRREEERMGGAMVEEPGP